MTVPDGIDYLPFQKSGIQNAIDEGTGAFVADIMGLGKARPLDAKSLTPAGWRRMGDIAVGGLVIGSAVVPTRAPFLLASALCQPISGYAISARLRRSSAFIALRLLIAVTIAAWIGFFAVPAQMDRGRDVPVGGITRWIFLAPILSAIWIWREAGAVHR